MGSKSLLGLLALTALFLCSACADKTVATHTAMLATPTFESASLQPIQVSWEQAVAATTTVRVNNSSLISMR